MRASIDEQMCPSPAAPTLKGAVWNIGNVVTLVMSWGVRSFVYPIAALGWGVARCERSDEHDVGPHSCPVGLRFRVPSDTSARARAP